MEYVYFFREKTSPYVKIGMSTVSVKSRFTSFKIYSPLGAYIVGFIETEDASRLEREIHIKNDAKRVGGEFFKMTDEEILILINNHDKSYSEIVTMIKLLTNELGITKETVFEIVKKKYEKQLFKYDLLSNENLVLAIRDLSGQFLTNTEIMDYLNDLNFNVSAHDISRLLKSLGINKKSKRVNGSLPKLVYFL